MNKFAIHFLCCSVVLVSSIFAKAAPSVEAQLASKSLLTDIVKTSQDHLIAVGERGHIIKSEDGINWSQKNVPVDVLLTAVFFVNNNIGWAVGHDATILRTNDAGEHWFVQQHLPETDKPLLDIHFRNENEGIAIGAYGLFFRTTNGGITWQEEFQSELLIEDDQIYLEELKEEDVEAYNLEKEFILPHFNRLYADGVTLFMVGEAGFMAKSNDFGSNWERLPEIYMGSFYDIIRTPKSSIIAIGLRGNIFRSTNNGVDWEQVTSPITASLNSAFVDQFNRVVLVGNAGAILISEDDGKSFKLIEQADRKAILNGIIYNKNLLLVSEVGIKQVNS
ncbi:WD40/YVTN/BNR-like repeat-containing protein [Flocculibacter collagenilyticus]|uniref:WD40/YVTN/BNR-like repeat-containing protein n=1 Tax=Flocculibacter collagenilyticus TaxID=2744479 RepID=UPI0018F7A473|nr:YCF48-related protein [Flocculibacter collagenilyticus]